MFFDDLNLAPRKGSGLAQAPPTPETGWRPPAEFPNLSAAVRISLDTETYDPELRTAGPGWGRGRGHIVGVGIGAVDRLGNRGGWYFPVRHEVEPEYNLDPRGVFGFAKEVLETPHIEKVGANLIYDYGWLLTEGIDVQGEAHDMQFGEALIDEYALVALDVLAHKYLNKSKTTDMLYEWIRAAYKPPKNQERREIYRTSPRLVGHYGESDVLLPLEIYPHIRAAISAQNLDYIYRMENDLIPLLVRMRMAGMRIDLNKADKVYGKVTGIIKELYGRVGNEFGYSISSTSTAQLACLFDTVGIPYLRTEKDNPSFRKEWLANLHHPLADIINGIREAEKIQTTFLQGYIFNKNINGMLYTSFHPLKDDENGTQVGRFSSSHPNLQNIPSRTELGKLVRTCFIPDEGHLEWRKHDYSQIHYRLLAHYAVDIGDGSANALRSRYINDPDTDYHLDVYKKVAPLMGWSTDYTQTEDKYGKLEFNNEIKMKRRPVKNYNFGLLYGQGLSSLEYKSGLSATETKLFSENYFIAAPYVKPTMQLIAQEVQTYGYVTTILGRRCRFNLFEPNERYRNHDIDPLPFHRALAEWGPNLRYAYDYRGVNYKFQGSEPDLMKKGMRECWQSGVFEVTGVPRLTVHDELDWSVREDTPIMREAFDYIKRTMQNAIKLRVPIKVDVSRGSNWGKAD